MPLPEPNLDDLRFQEDLVDEARRRIVRYCPEWTDYNVSDPGITLIELFAWMTEMMVYRLNRVPEKSYVKFMELLGVQLQPASSARAELTFRLSGMADMLEERRRYRFAEQLRAAGLSISNNIAEGSGSDSNREFRHFLNISRRSAFECASMILMFQRQDLIRQEEVQPLLVEINRVCRMITAFSRSLG